MKATSWKAFEDAVVLHLGGPYQKGIDGIVAVLAEERDRCTVVAIDWEEASDADVVELLQRRSLFSENAEIIVVTDVSYGVRGREGPGPFASVAGKLNEFCDEYQGAFEEPVFGCDAIIVASDGSALAAGHHEGQLWISRLPSA